MELEGKRIVLGVTGSVAAYKAAVLLRLLTGAGAKTQVAMTDAATRFVGPATFAALSGKLVLTDLWAAADENPMTHIDITRAADAILIAPATADCLARLAQGRADDLLAAMTLARACPLLVAPAMNRRMWENPATQRNLEILRQDGVTCLGPDTGLQACGEEGEGRMLAPETLLEVLRAFFTPNSLAGKKVLLTAGPTFEALDPVRGITNLSSGCMGYAVARAAARAGAEVTLVSGPVAQAAPMNVACIPVQSALEMYRAVMQRATTADIFIAVAAVADYRAERIAPQKLKKSAGSPPEIRLAQNPDILAEVAALPNPPFCVGFAAESERLEDHAQQKRARKGVPLIVGNLIQEGFGGETNHVILFDDAGSHPLPVAPKIQIARQLLAHILALMEKK
ncbi:MAG: bifunctional phosphopantothenoylcysteine decarboxylase/phosphopantothenate--cysteine ligase CoaBC [Zoogloeaceae bacterium]|jgi:phosphopantothenoylcysteine decarboxylase/phosphopantothenate--cysteine ligase|nr:bifunctional phosphopantothenoylcysteine decarboxylase/phosphopantothenate--cysteine ligase CoaBC [Zoogloeaceae bacterium]